MQCQNCHAELIGKYCHNCGQKQFTSKDKNLRTLFNDAFHFVTHFEGTFFKTFKAVLFYPGQLSLDYCNGVRKRYYKPISFFLILIVIYLLFPLMRGMNMEMQDYKSLDFSGAFITEQIADKTQLLGVSESELAKRFDEKSEKASKILLLLLLPLTAMALFVLFPNKRRRPFYDHFILATEINSLILLSVFLILPIVYLAILSLFPLPKIDDAILPFIAVLLLMYFTITFRKFYQSRWVISVVKSGLFLLLYYVISQVIYKFILFETVYHLI